MPALRNPTSHIKSHWLAPIISWASIVGGALTLFGNLQTFLQLSEWVTLLVSHYRAIASQFWNFAAQFFQMEISDELATVLSWLVLMTGIAVGVRLRTGCSTERATAMSVIGAILGAAVVLMILQLIYFGVCYAIYPLPLSKMGDDPTPFEQAVRSNPILYATGFISYYAAGLTSIMFGRMAKKADLGFYNLSFLCSLILVAPSLGHIKFADANQMWALLLFRDLGSIVLPRLLILIAPSAELVTKLRFVLIGLGILLAMNFVGRYFT